MTLADERSPDSPSSENAQDILETFIETDSDQHADSTDARGSIPFAFKAGAALFGLISATGTVLSVPARDADAAEIRYAGDWTSTQPVSANPALPWVPRPATNTRLDSAVAAQLAASPEITGKDIVALYELSGLTYRQLAATFGVSERSLHLWANGATKPAPRHLERLRSVLDAVRRLDAPDTSSRRAALLRSPDGTPSLYSTWLRELAAGAAPVGDVESLHEPARHA